MTGSVSSRLVDGELVVVKRADGQAAADRLAHEADMLSRLNHPSLVSLVHFDRPDPVQGELTTRMVGTDTMATWRPGGPEELTRALASVAATLADLHSSGFAHGGVQAEHVIMSPAGRPILCSLGSAVTSGPDGPGARADVAALGAMILAVAPAGGSRASRSRGPRPWRRTVRSGAALRAIGNDARQPELSRRPTAAAVAVALAELQDGAAGESDPAQTGARPLAHHRGDIRLVAPAGPPLRPWPEERPTQPWSRPSVPQEPAWRPRRLLVLGAGAVALAAATGLALGRAVEPSPATGPAATELAGGPASEGRLTEATGGLIEYGSRRYRSTDGDDRLLVGDWDCDGVATVALLRPGSGEVFVFARWPVGGEPVLVEAVAQVPGATDLLAGDPDTACPTLLVASRIGLVAVDLGS